MAVLEDDTFVSLVRQSPRPLAKQIQATLDSPSGMTGEAGTLAELPPELRHHPRYQIVELIGRGGMGDVYKAQHKVMDRTVALKVIRPELVKHAAAVERFRREVQAAARLHHANIVTAYDAEQAGDAHFLVMEFVDGVDLSQVVQERGPLPVTAACDYVRQAATGLEHARQLGMVHRDIKPHNLMLTGGEIKILDFGLANFANEVMSEETGDDAPTGADATLRSLQQLTQMGTMMGTPDYIAPEQAADARTADIRSDIYSLGCTLSYLLTAKPVFEGTSVTDKLKAHAEQPPKQLTETRSDIPPELQQVVDRMLAKDPAQRFQTPAEVADALSPFAAERSFQSVPASSQRRTLRTLLIATAAILLAGVIFITTDKGRIEIRTEVNDVEVVVSQDGKEIETIDLATGSQVKWLPSGDYRISLKQDRNDIQITPNGFKLSRWGKQIVSLSRPPRAAVASAQKLADLPDGAMSETVTTGYNGSFEVTKSGLPVSWSFYTPRTVPKGDFDIVMDKTDFKEGEQSLKFVVRKCEPTGGRLSPGFFNEFHTNLSPPGPFDTLPGETYKISFWAKNAGSEFVFKARGVSAKEGDKGAIISSKETFNEWRRFECTHTIPLKPKMHLRLELNVVQPGTFWIDDIQIVRVNDKALAQPDALVEVGRFAGHEGGASQVIFSPSGKYGISCGSDKTIRVWDIATQEEKQVLKGHEGMVFGLAVSKDGKLLASCDNAKSIRLWSLETFEQVGELTGHTDAVTDLAFLPDRTHLLSAGFDDTLRLWHIVDRKLIRTIDIGTKIEKMAPLPDGRRVVLSGAHTRGWGPRIYDLEKGEQIDATPNASSCMAVSADGRMSLIGSITGVLRVSDTDNGELIVQMADPRANAARDAAITTDGRFAITTTREQHMYLWDLHGGKLLASESGETIDTVTLSPDGRYAVTIGRSGGISVWRLPESVLEPIGATGQPLPLPEPKSQPTPRVNDKSKQPETATPPRAGLLTNPPKLPPEGLTVGKNLIVDPSLEDTPIGQVPKGWFAWLNDGPDFKCEVVEGGVTGKHCLQISGTGTRGVVFATSISLDRTKRYALKGHVKVEGEAGTWAIIKLNYFNNTGWLGVDDRIGVTTADIDWKLLEKTDRAEQYPGATLLVPTCHIEGNGTAWFDDLEVIAYDREMLPDDFDAKHGRNNRMK